MKKFKIYTFTQLPVTDEEYSTDRYVETEKGIIVTQNDGTRIHVPWNTIMYVEEKNV